MTSKFLSARIESFYHDDAVDLGGKIELQWFFCDYLQPNEVVAFCAQITADVEIPSIRDFVPSAWLLSLNSQTSWI
jgi:hypothetical protein